MDEPNKVKVNDHSNDLCIGYWPGSGYVTFREQDKTTWGTIQWKNVLGVYGSIEEAQASTTRSAK